MLGFCMVMFVGVGLISLTSYYISWELQHEKRRPAFWTKVHSDCLRLIARGRGATRVSGMWPIAVKRIMNLKSMHRENVLRAIREAAIDAALGAVCSGLFGLMLGGFGAVVHGEPWRIISIAAYCALCGAAAGALVGAVGGFLQGEEEREPAEPHAESTTTTDTPIPAVHNRTSLVGLSHTQRRRGETFAARTAL